MLEIKQKSKLRWRWFLAIPVMFALLFVAQLWGPNPKLRISPETTFITSHIGPDGYPDYKAYLHSGLDSDMPVANNAAVPIWRAMWPGELSAKDMPLITQALRMPTPDPAQALVHLHNTQLKDELAAMIKANGTAGHVSELDFDRDQAVYDLAEKLIDQSMVRPWTSEQVPALAKWARTNQQALDWLVEGAGRPGYYNPSPSMLSDENDSLVEMLLPGIQMLRTAARGLTARAMWHLGEGRTQEAWRDLRACHQIARHTKSGTTLIENLVGIAVESMASEGTQTLLHHGNLNSEAARQILAELQKMPQMQPLSESLTNGERLAYLDCVTRLAKGEWDLRDFQALIASDANDAVAFVTSTKIDWNIVLEDGNRWYDRLADAVSLPRTERKSAIQKVTAEIERLGTANSAAMLLGSLFSSNTRSHVMSDLLIMQFLPALDAVARAWDRSDTILDLNKVSAALAVYRAEHGHYPETLGELVPGILTNMPLDFYSGSSFRYQRNGDGYLLYSVFENGVDDGGSSFDGRIVKGTWADESASVDYQKSDIVVLLPRPDFEMPQMVPDGTDR